jgi:hypothetical protein
MHHDDASTTLEFGSPALLAPHAGRLLRAARRALAALSLAERGVESGCPDVAAARAELDRVLRGVAAGS